MIDLNRSELAKTQTITKPAIEDVIADVLNGDAKKNALDFVSYLQKNKMKPVWASANAWKVSYKGQVICYIRLYNDEWKNSK